MINAPSLSPKKLIPAWLTQVTDHLVPNQILRIFEFQGKREGKVFCFQRLVKVLIGVDSRILKMRRLLPTCIHSKLPTYIYPEIKQSGSAAGRDFKGENANFQILTCGGVYFTDKLQSTIWVVLIQRSHKSQIKKQIARTYEPTDEKSKQYL